MRTSLSLDGVFVHPHGLCESDEVGHGTQALGIGARAGRRAQVIVTAHGLTAFVDNPGRLIGWACICGKRPAA